MDILYYVYEIGKPSQVWMRNKALKQLNQSIHFTGGGKKMERKTEPNKMEMAAHLKLSLIGKDCS
jgi:hypothetical protein